MRLGSFPRRRNFRKRFGQSAKLSYSHCSCRQVYKHPNPPTAIACYNDIVALGVILQLKLSGLTVGKDIAISGCDNIQESEYSHPSLTTVSTNIRQMGREAARLLNKRILGDEEDPIKVIVPSKLIIRDSSVGIQKPIQINL